ncbi:MAG: AAA family ATPase [Candidatus Aenigmarchaeota archaeon]|nr:AAA family ATPase [Candidatus Aenigmarchaeota archaeon]
MFEELPPIVDDYADLDLISEFIKALDEEIEEIKSNRGNTVVRVLDGRFICEEAGHFLYSFTLENSLTVLDDSPVDIIVGNVRYPGKIVQSKGMEVVIGVEHDLGKRIPEAYLTVNLYFLYELLKKRYFSLVLSEQKHQNFYLSNLVFKNGKGWRGNLKISLDIPELNESQVKAVEKSQSQQLTILWGPPGTGKTKTLAYMVYCFVKRGLSVLVVAHSNAAVDELTEKIADLMADSELYKQGRIVRLGICGEKLENKFVSFEKIVECFEKKLKRELDELDHRKVEIIDKLEDLQSKIRERENLEKEYKEISVQLERLQSELETIYSHRSKLKSKIIQKEAHVDVLRIQLQQVGSMNKIKRLLLGFNPDKIKAEIERERFEIKKLTKELEELEKKRNILEDDRKPLEIKVKSLRRKLGRLPEIQKEYEKLKEELKSVESEIERVKERLNKVKIEVLENAKVLCTTLTKTFSDRNFPNKPFDVLIVDEGSMAPLPYLYWALSKCRRFVVIAGDFLQLPPVCMSDGDMAKKWLKRDVFSVLGVDRVDKAKNDERVCLLDIQYRMNPEISKIVNELFYGGNLKDAENTLNHTVEDGISSHPLTLVDTSSASPWCSYVLGSRVNIYTAVLSVSLAERIVESTGCDVAIISPFAAQVRLINKILKEKGLDRRVIVGTVHRFQGGESDVVIFDTVEGPGAGISQLLDDSKDETSNFLINVALTRAKCKLFLIANTKHLKENLPSNSKILKIIEIFEERGETISSGKFVNSYFAKDFEKSIRDMFRVRSEDVPSVLYRENDFYPAFFRDLMNAKKRVIIVSPFVTFRRLSKFMDIFKLLTSRGVEVRIYTRPIKDLAKEEYSPYIGKAFEQLKSMGVEVIERSNIHFKIAVIDDDVEWEGSLNILSHRDTEEIMRRFKSKSVVEEVLRLLDLQETSEEFSTFVECSKCGRFMVMRVDRNCLYMFCPNCFSKYKLMKGDRVLTQVKCPDCGSYMVLRWSHYGPFLGCSRYPQCTKTRSL